MITVKLTWHGLVLLVFLITLGVREVGRWISRRVGFDRRAFHFTWHGRRIHENSEPADFRRVILRK
jgi:hypothetical protein